MTKVLHGNVNGNQLNANVDKSQVYGLKGNDTLISDNKNDVLLVGGSGDDSLIMLGGTGTLSGGEGSDVFELNYSAEKKLSAVIEDLEPSSDKIVVKFNGNTTPQLTSVKSGNDVVWKDGDGFFNVTLKSVRDNDYFDGTVSEEAWKVLELTNAEREAQGLSPLTMSDGLTTGASIRAEEITSLGVLGLLTNHDRPGSNGQPDPDKPYSTIFKEIGKKYANYGENLDGGAASPEDVVAQWMGSESHKENILNSTYKKIGVGYNYDDPDPTNHRYYWTQLFGDSLTADSLGNPETVSASSLLSADIQTFAASKFIPLSDGANFIDNSDYGITIKGTAQADSITNDGLNVSISGVEGDDTIESGGSFTTINGGTGNDLITLGASTKENVIVYNAGDGNDFVSGLHATDTLKVFGNEFTPVTIGNDVIVSVGTDSIILTGAANLDSLNIDGTRSKLYIFTEDDDLGENTIESATLDGLGGNDTLRNGFFWDNAQNNFVFSHSNNVSMNGGDGNDLIGNISANVTIDGGIGNDSIENIYGLNVTINGGEGDDSILNQEASFATVTGYVGNDTILNEWADNISVNSGENDDFILNYESKNITIDAGEGDDIVRNQYNQSLKIDGGAGNDYISGYLDDYITMSGSAGSDTISNSGTNSSLDAGDGDDTISNSGANSTLVGGEGNDSIGNDVLATWNSLTGSYNIFALPENVTIAGGEGNNTIINSGAFVSITTGDGNNYISNSATVRLNSLTGSYDTLSTPDNVTIKSGAGKDDIRNSVSQVTIDGGAGNDSIRNSARVSWDSLTNSFQTLSTSDNVSIFGGADNDYLFVSGSNVTISGGLDNDKIVFDADAQNVLIEYKSGDGKDSVIGFDESDTLKIGDGTGTYSAQTLFGNVLVEVGTGSVLLEMAASLSTLNIEGTPGEPSKEEKIIVLSEDDDFYENESEGAIILAYGGNDSISNTGANVQIYSNSGDKLITNTANNFEVEIGAGNDSITNTGNNVKIKVGGGNDSILNSGLNISIDGGKGDDQISLSSDSRYNLIKYNSGDGNDSIWGFGADDSLSISGSAYSPATVDNDLVVAVGVDSITLLDAATLSAPVIIFTSSGGDSENKLITLTEGDDAYKNTLDGATIAALGGNDSITNYFYSEVSINGGADNDYIYSTGDAATIDGSAGDDTIYGGGDLSSITGGEGNDDIDYDGSNNSIISGAGNDSIINYGTNSTVDGGEDDDLIRNGSEGNFVSITGGAGKDTVWNYGSDVSIDGGTGDDSIVAGGDSVTVDSGDDNDHIENHATNSSIFGGAGSDTVWNHVSEATIDGGEDDDYIDNAHEKDFVSIVAGAGNDSIYNYGANSTIDGGVGDDYIENSGANVSIIGDNGNDSISNYGSQVLIDSGDNYDYIFNHSETVSIISGAGDDSIFNDSENVSIVAGAGNDSIRNEGANVTISGGTGNDSVSLSSDAKNILINYTAGDGKDILWGYSANTSINIAGAKYTTRYDHNDLIYEISNGSITLKEARNKPKPIIIGESGSTNGNSSGPGGNNSSNGNSSGSGNGGSNPGGNSGGSNSTGGTSSSEGRGSDASGSQSSGSGSAVAGASTGVNSGSSGSSSSSRGGNSSVQNATALANSSDSATTIEQPATMTEQPVSGQHFYTGGNQVISNYQSGEKIIFAETYTGSTFDDKGTFLASSSTGVLAVQNATDKFIDLADVSGNTFLEVFAATNPTVIDGRGREGFKIFNGSDEADEIYAGDGGAQLWGGNNFVSDTLIGGAGNDIFIGGKNQGSDMFLNVSASDEVHLDDVRLSDISGIKKDNDVITFSFKTGSEVKIQSTDTVSGAIVLADSTWHFKHAT